MRVGAEYQARIPDFEPGKWLFGCNLTSPEAGGVGSPGAPRRRPRGCVGGALEPLCRRSGAGGGRLGRGSIRAPGAGDSHFIIGRVMCIRREAVKQEKKKKKLDFFFFFLSLSLKPLTVKNI